MLARESDGLIDDCAVVTDGNRRNNLGPDGQRDSTRVPTRRPFWEAVHKRTLGQQATAERGQDRVRKAPHNRCLIIAV